MLAEAIETKGLGGGMECPVGAKLVVSVLRRPGRDFGMKALAIADDRREQFQLAAFAGLFPELAAEFVPALRLDRNAAVGTMLHAHPGEKQAQVVEYFRDRGDGALAAAARVALLDADRGGDAGDEIDVRARKLLDELSRVGAHGIQEPPLSLGEKEVEGECAFARTADAGDDDKLVARNGDREVLQIMLASAMDGYGAGVFGKWGASVKHGETVSASLGNDNRVERPRGGFEIQVTGLAR